jgi:hypothetical protein
LTQYFLCLFTKAWVANTFTHTFKQNCWMKLSIWKIQTDIDTWVFLYDLQIKHQSFQWKSPDSKMETAWLSKWKVKTMLTWSVGIKGIIHYKFFFYITNILPSSSGTFIAIYLLNRWNFMLNKWILHHETVPSYTALSKCFSSHLTFRALWWQ